MKSFFCCVLSNDELTKGMHFLLSFSLLTGNATVVHDAVVCLDEHVRVFTFTGVCLCAADMTIGDIGCMQKLGITESFQVKRQVIISGAEAAEMIIRVDNIIKAAPRQRPHDDRCH
jgi:hypothetical protein